MTRQEKEVQGIKPGEEETHLSLSADDIILEPPPPPGDAKKALWEQISKYNKAEG